MDLLWVQYYVSSVPITCPVCCQHPIFAGKSTVLLLRISSSSVLAVFGAYLDISGGIFVSMSCS